MSMMSVSVFGRLHPYHDYDDALGKMFNSDPQAAAMALNLRHDHRISPRREASFDRHLKRLGKQLKVERKSKGPIKLDANYMEQAVKDYFNRKVKRKFRPHFLFPRLNAANILNDGDQRHGLPVGTKLVRVFNLNQTWRLFAWKSRKSRAWKRDLSWNGFAKPSSESYESWLNAKLEGREPDEQRGVVEMILNLVEEARPTHTWQPSWATSWEEFSQADFPSAPADRWCEAVGVHHERPNQWVILLVYSVTAEMKIAKPTQLDAGWAPWHYPTPDVTVPPNQAPSPPHGHPMELNTDGDPLAVGLLPEYIHLQVHHPIEHFDAAGGLIRQTGVVKARKLHGEQRRRHRERLVKYYGEPVVP